MLRKGQFWIRPLMESDLDFVLWIRTDESTSKYLNTFIMANEDTQRAWFEHIQKDKSKAYLVFGKDKKRIGYVRITDIDWVNRSMCVGGDIAPKWRGLGYGKKMYALVKCLGFDKWNMNRLWLKVLKSNRIAFELYKKVGFVEEGVERESVLRDGMAIDCSMMSMLRREYKESV